MVDYDECSEAEVAGGTKELQPHSEASLTREVKDLVHTLQRHLEMQNQKLLEMQQALEESHNRYVDLYDFAPVGYLTLDPQGRILELNLMAAALMGEERSALAGELFGGWVSQKDTPAFLSFLKAACGAEGKAAQELQLRRRDGKIIHGHLESWAIRDPKDGMLNCRVALLDISAQVRMQAQLHQHREELFRLAQPAHE